MSAATRAVLVDHPVERPGAPEVEAVTMLAGPRAPACGPAAVAAVPAKIVSAAEEQRARPPHARRSVVRPRLAGLVGGAPGQRHGSDEDHHRQHEVGHHVAGRQVVA